MCCRLIGAGIAYPPLPGRIVLTRSTIEEAGLVHLGDLLLLAENWQLSTTDGFTWQAAVNGLGTFQEQQWMIMVDGVRVDWTFLGINQLNMLPLSLFQIDSVELISVPQLHYGEFTDRGLIHIHLAAPEKGKSGWLALAGGNETGDPGPYRLTDWGTPNVERVANDGAAGVGYGGEGAWRLVASIRYSEYPFTDFYMLKRNTAMVSNWPSHHAGTSPFLQIRHTGRRGSQTLTAGYSYFYNYFHFFPPLGREVPIIAQLGHMALRGETALGDMEISYWIKYSTTNLGKIANTLDFNFDWNDARLGAGSEMSRRGDNWQAWLGIGLDREKLQSGYYPSREELRVAKVYGRLHLAPSSGWTTDISTMLLSQGRQQALKASVATQWRLRPNHRLLATVSTSERLPAESNSLWQWVNRGYGLLENYGLEYEIQGDLSTSSQSTLDMDWIWAVTSATTLDAGIVYRRFSELLLTEQSFVLQPADASFHSPTRIYGGQQGLTLGGEIRLVQLLGKNFRHRLTYLFQPLRRGDDLFKRVWGTLPRHKATYRLTLKPVPGFVIWGMLTFRSRADFEDYRPIDGQTVALTPKVDLIYRSSIGPSVVFDLQLKKQFWHERLSGSLLMRNLGTRELRYHPIGGAFDLAVYLQVVLKL